MWTIKYKPKSLNEVADQKEAKLKLIRWLDSWKPGGRAALLYGPPGNGKTCTVEALATERNLDLIEMNASDVRSRDRVERVLGRGVRVAPLFGARGRIILIDEVDGLQASADRGGVRAIMNIIKESAFPVILTANDPWSRSLYQLRGMCELIEFRKVPIRDVVKRLDYICRMEGIRADLKVLHAIAARNQGDMRAAIIDLEAVAEGKRQITMDDLEALGFREREASIFEALRGIFKSRSALSARLAVNDLDMDPMELFWWIEQNIMNEYEKPEDLARAYEALAKADLFRSRIIRRQNWRMQGYMIDLMTAGVSQAKDEPYRKFTKYQRPDRLSFLSTTMVEREHLRKVLSKLATRLHCSTRKVKSEFIPYILYLMREKPDFTKKLASSLNIEEDELKILHKFYGD